MTPGTEAEPDVARRAEFVLAHSTRWSAVWFAWVLASTGLVAFFAQWSSRLSELGACPRTAWFGTAVVAFGACFDLSGEVINVAFLTRPGIWPEEYAFLATLYTLIGPGGANGLYCVGGLLLATLSWRHRFVRGPLGIHRYLFAQSLELSASNVFQVHSLRPLCCRLIEVNRDAKPFPDGLAHPPGNRYAIINRHLTNRDKRHHVRSPHSRVCSRVFREID